jgi:hypothetical protein
MTTTTLSNVPSLEDRPWLPITDDDVELNVFNGRPSAGLISNEFGAVLFWQFSGHGSGIGMWVYLQVTDSEAEYIIDHMDDDLLEGLSESLIGRQGVLALSWDGKIRARGPFSFGKNSKDSSVIVQLLEAMAEGLKRIGGADGRGLPSGRQVEVLEGDGLPELSEDATSLVRATLATCGA